MKTDTGKTVEEPLAGEAAGDTLSRGEIEGGLRFGHLVSEGLRREVQNSSTTLYALLDVLIAKGVVSYREMEQARTATEPVVQEHLSLVPGIRLGTNVDKYDPELPVTIPCEERLHTCKAACCHMTFPLTVQDLQEGGIRWDLYMPYQIARRPDGACVHLGSDLRCTIHSHRPAVCRGFDCRQDKRVWQDFEKAIPSPELGGPPLPKST